MSTQQLIYAAAVPLNSGRHAQHAVDIGADYSFVRGVNSVPVMAVEFPHCFGDFPIVFAGNPDAITPVVILGARADQNVYLSEEGKWLAKYLPAFVRRYPFVFSSSDDQSTFTLCVDESFAGFNTEGRGEKLFDAEGKPSAYVEGVLKFLQEYRQQHLVTQAFARKIVELDLLEPMQAQFTLAEGETLSLNGFMVVNRTRLQNLSGEILAELAKTGQLELIYLHLHSLTKFTEVKDRLNVKK